MSLERAALESLDFLIYSEEGKLFAMHPVTCHKAGVGAGRSVRSALPHAASASAASSPSAARITAPGSL